MSGNLSQITTVNKQSITIRKLDSLEELLLFARQFEVTGLPTLSLLAAGAVISKVLKYSTDKISLSVDIAYIAKAKERGNEDLIAIYADDNRKSEGRLLLPCDVLSPSVNRLIYDYSLTSESVELFNEKTLGKTPNTQRIYLQRYKELSAELRHCMRKYRSDNNEEHLTYKLDPVFGRSNHLWIKHVVTKITLAGLGWGSTTQVFSEDLRKFMKLYIHKHLSS